jgi:hypothetical protein
VIVRVAGKQPDCEACRQSSRAGSNGAAMQPPAYGVQAVDDGVAQQLTKRFGSFLAGKIQKGQMTVPQAARALRLYRSTEAGKRDLFFHDNAVAALAAKRTLAASNIGIEGYQALAAAPELVASGKYKLLAGYRKNVVEQLQEQLAEANVKARQSGLEVLRRAYRENGPMAALDAAKQIASFADDPIGVVNLLIAEEQQRVEADKAADLRRQAKYLCKKEMIATDEMCDDFFDNVDQRATLGAEGEIEFSDASLSADPAKDWQLNAEQRTNRESLLTPEEKADREALSAARNALFRIDALEGAGKALSTGFHDLFVGMPGDLMTYGANSLLDTNYAYRSSFGRELSAELGKGKGTDVARIQAELAKGNAADMAAIQAEIDQGHFSKAQLEILTSELGRRDRDFRKIKDLLEQGKGTDYWKVADLVGKTAVDMGSTLLSLVPGAQGVGLMGKAARVANVVGDVLFIYDTLSSARAGVDAALAGDGRGFGEAFGGMLQAPIMKVGGAALGHGFGAVRDMRASRRSPAPFDLDVDAAADRAFSQTFGDEHIGQLSKAEQATLAAGEAIPGAYIHSVRRGNAFEFASTTNLPVFKQLLTHISFEDKHALVDVGSGGHGGVTGNSHIVDPSLRDSSFVGANERMATQAGAMANVWDLGDAHDLTSWLSRRSSASNLAAGSGGRYAIADWCYSAFTGADGKGPMRPLYMGSELRAAQIASLARLEAMRKALANPRQLVRDITGLRSADGPDSIHAARSADAPGDRLARAEAQRRAAIESQRAAVLGDRVGKPLDPTGRYLEAQGTRPGSLHEKVQMERAWMKKEFGDSISPTSYEIVPRRNERRYNCFAFTLGELSTPVQPKSARVLDPARPFADVSEMYSQKGYVLTQQAPRLNFSGPGRPKIVVYGKVEGGKIIEITHAAIQEADGMWTSKMGPDGPLVRHATPGAVSGKTLGQPVAIYEPG